MLDFHAGTRAYPTVWRPSLSPILVRPVREQLEHDRIIRLLQTKFRRKYEAGMNPGAEQNAPVGTVGSVPPPMYPDLVLMSQDRGHRLQGIVEVETGESVNHLEALAEWAHFARARAPFHLYVPAGMVDVARRLCEDNKVYVSEIWSYHTVGDQVRFTMVHRNKETPPAAPRKPAPAVKSVAAKPVVNGAASTAKAPAAKVKKKKPAARKPAAAKKKSKPAAKKKK
jgi:hypothetical protein